MAVAVKNASEASSRGLFDRLPAATLAGIVYVLASLGLAFGALPRLWDVVVSPWLAPVAGFVNAALLGLAILAAVGLLALFGLRLVAARPIPGLRAGIFFGLLGVLVAGLLTRWASIWIEHWVYHGRALGETGKVGGIVVTAAVGVVLLGLLARLFTRPSFQRWLIKVEEQGWFSATSYKPSQGQRVRRGTILGILILVGAGVWTMLQSKRLEAGPADWAVNVPFTGVAHVQQANDLAATEDFKKGFPDWKPGEPLALDRYALRDLNDRLAADYVRIVEPGRDEFGFETGQVVPKQTYGTARGEVEGEIQDLEARARAADEANDNLRAQQLRSEIREKRAQVPNAVPPTPATERTTFASLTLLPAVRFTLPLLLGAAAVWLAWRVVNLPVFADFLIATEAELNKVSWTTRRRLVQDTIVVLTAVVLLTFYLLFADIVWSSLLRGIGVLRFGTGPTQTQTQQDKEQPW